MCDRESRICKGINRRFVYFLVFGCVQMAVIGISFIYVQLYTKSFTFINLYSKKEKLSSKGSTFSNMLPEISLGATESMSELYFTPNRSNPLYVWKNGDLVPVKPLNTFSKGTVMQLITRADCSRLENKTKFNIYKRDKEPSNCTAIRHEVDNVNKYVFREELDMPIAFSILAYTDYDMLEILLRTIYKHHNTYCIHVDAKSPRSFRERVIKLTTCFDNVFVANELYSVYWGKFGILEAEMSCMKDLLNKTKSWKYFINLTGQEFPLRTNYEITKILAALRGFNNVRCLKNFEISRLKVAGPPPYGLTVYKTGTHVALTRKFVVFMLKDEKAQKVLNWAKKLRVPDEMVFSTLNCNRKLKAPGSFDAYPSVFNQRKGFITRLKLWHNHTMSCYGKLVRGICIFGPRDLQKLQTRHELFANKFHIYEYPEVVYCLRDTILKRTVMEYSGYLDFNDTFYKNIPYKH